MASCLKEAKSHKIEWFDAYEREVLEDMLPCLEGVLGNIDGTLVKI